ncbi:MAG: DUF1883 domain-containing protein [Defluviitaleaceae bacterium]|nr:DUF1883 domain-containing protein [Defluviitaleaceae bacterium]
MNYTHYDLGGLGKGKTVEVILQGNAANVYLMDHENVVKYSKGLEFSALGGHMTFSPIRLQTTDSAHWHIIVDLPHGYGTVKTSYRIVGKQPPNISTKPSTFKPTEAQKRATAAATDTLGLGKKFLETTEKKPIAAPKPSDEISCKSCGILTKQGKFCTSCGAPLAKVCLRCSASNEITDKFCFECGSHL